MNGEQPLMQWDMRALHDGAGAASEFVPAVIAKEITGLSSPGHLMDSEGTAVRAVHAMRPARGFDMLAGGVFIVKAGSGQISHWSISND